MARFLRKIRMIVVAVAVCFSVQAQCAQANDESGVGGRPFKHIVETGMADTHATPEQLIALDFVSTLMQIDSHRPDQVAFTLAPAADAFAENLRKTLEMVGYAIGSTDSDDPLQSISYLTSDTHASQGLIRTYQINVGQIKLRRDYLINGNIVRPVSTIYLQGADTAGIALNDEIFMGDVTGSDNAEVATTTVATALPEISLHTLNHTESYRVGDQIVLSVATDEETRLYCYYQDGHGQIARIYPNRFNTDNLVQAGQSVLIPGTDDWDISATRIGSSDDFLCLGADPLNLEVIAVLNEDPDLEPLAARSLDQIQQGLTISTNRPIAFKKLSLTVQ